MTKPVRSKSIDKEPVEHYEKINDKIPLPDDITIPSTYSVPFKVKPHETQHETQHETFTTTRTSNALYDLKESIKNLNTSINEFKTAFYNYLLEDKTINEKGLYYIEYTTPKMVYLYSDSFSKDIINKINQIAELWNIEPALESENPYYMYKLKMTISLKTDDEATL